MGLDVLNLRTHIIVGVGAASFIAVSLGCDLDCYLASTLIAMIHHPIIDYVSHDRGRRTALFHSIPGLYSLALVTSLPFLFVIPLSEFVVVFASSMASCLSHWVLDLLTFGGVYIRRRRVSLRLFKYDDPSANLSFQVLGLLLFLYSLASLTF